MSRAPDPSVAGQRPVNDRSTAIRHVVQFSSGAGSWGAAKRVVAAHGAEAVTLLFADTLIEDADNYRFLDEAAANVGAPLVRIADGRTPWELFHAEGMIGNTRADLCSRILKRDLLQRWLRSHCDPATTVVHFGVDWTEAHRIARLRSGPLYAGFTLSAPLCDAPHLTKADVLAWLRAEDLEPPRLYALGFPHANCGGFCVKAGQAQFERLYRTMPERYAEHEAEEQRFRAATAKNVSILRDRTGGQTTPLTLRAFRERLANGDLFDAHAWGGCGCAL